MFGMMMYLICVDQLAKIGHHTLVIEKGEFFWMSGIDHGINGINVLGIEVSPKEDMSMWKTSCLILDSPYKGGTLHRI
jgi:hypothetical protein